MADSQTNTETEYLIPEIATALLRGPLWLKDERKSARVTFNEAPLPRRGVAFWRYTDPNRFLVAHDTITEGTVDGQLTEIKSSLNKLVDDTQLDAFVIDRAGSEIIVKSNDRLNDQKVIVSSLSAATETHTDIVQKHLCKLVAKETGKFEALNSALWNDGIFIYVPDGVTVEKPIHLLREAGSQNSMTFARLLVVVGKNAEVTIIDEYSGGSHASGSDTQTVSNTNGAVEIFGAHDSRTQYLSVQRQNDGGRIYLSHRAKIEQGASMLTLPMAFGAQTSKQSFGVILNGRGADSRMYGLLFGSKKQFFDNHTIHHHAAGNTTSDIDFKVVLRDKAESAYTGLIKIDREAKTCEAYQENRNLVLNKGTKAETIPELEILNEDVKCSHGATIGPIDPDAIFYLGARGIKPSDATRMIVKGFVEKTLKRIPENLRAQIDVFVTERLEGI